MGLSRNKVAVPEGAAGTPPFWSTSKEQDLGRISPIRLVRLMSPTKSRDVKQMVCFASPALLGALSFKIEKQ